jgi:hypothetical protein
MPAAACSYCGRPAMRSGTRCRECAKADADRELAKRKKRLEAGLCPQCGKARLATGEKSCLKCMLKVKDGDDFVGPIVKSRGWKKRL